MTILFGGIQYPLSAPGLNGNLLSVADPFAAKFLPYFANGIRSYCSAAYNAAYPPDSAVAAANGAVGQTAYIDPVEFLGTYPWRHPLLALFPWATSQRAGVKYKTFEKVSTATRYRLCYVLPPLDALQAERLLPLLVSVHHLLVSLVHNYNDPSTPGVPDILQDAGIDELKWVGTEYTFLGKPFDGATGEGVRHPSVISELEVSLLSAFPSDAGPDMEVTKASIANNDGDAAGPVDMVDVEVEPEA